MSKIIKGSIIITGLIGGYVLGRKIQNEIIGNRLKLKKIQDDILDMKYLLGASMFKDQDSLKEILKMLKK